MTQVNNPIDYNIYDKIKVYAENKNAIAVSKGRNRLCEDYKNDMLRYMETNDLRSYLDLMNFCHMYLNEMFSKIYSMGVVLDQTQKQYSIHEITDASGMVFKSIDKRELFNDLLVLFEE